ncbi:MAG: hypothetical protein ACXVEF_14200 [Polyangiales bacterium]
MSSLKDSIARLAEGFATQVLSAIRSASLEDIAHLSGGRAPAAAAAAPRAGRRGPGRPAKIDVAGLAGKVGELLKGKSDGLRAEQIRESLGVAKNQLVKVITKGLADGSLKKTGEKRATKYFVGSGTPSAGAAKPAGKRRAKRRGKKG